MVRFRKGYRIGRLGPQTKHKRYRVGKLGPQTRPVADGREDLRAELYLKDKGTRTHARPQQEKTQQKSQRRTQKNNRRLTEHEERVNHEVATAKQSAATHTKTQSTRTPPPSKARTWTTQRNRNTRTLEAKPKRMPKDAIPPDQNPGCRTCRPLTARAVARQAASERRRATARCIVQLCLQVVKATGPREVDPPTDEEVFRSICQRLEMGGGPHPHHPRHPASKSPPHWPTAPGGPGWLEPLSFEDARDRERSPEEQYGKMRTMRAGINTVTFETITFLPQKHFKLVTVTVILEINSSDFHTGPNFIHAPPPTPEKTLLGVGGV